MSRLLRVVQCWRQDGACSQRVTENNTLEAVLGIHINDVLATIWRGERVAIDKAMRALRLASSVQEDVMMLHHVDVVATPRQTPRVGVWDEIWVGKGRYPGPLEPLILRPHIVTPLRTKISRHVRESRLEAVSAWARLQSPQDLKVAKGQFGLCGLLISSGSWETIRRAVPSHSERQRNARPAPKERSLAPRPPCIPLFSPDAQKRHRGHRAETHLPRTVASL